MALVVEDGTGIADANSYIEAAWADTYHADRGNTAWASAQATAKEQALIKATDYIETRFGDRFKGFPEFIDTPQGLSFPRLKLYDRYGQVITGIPDNLKKATAEYALRALEAELMPDPDVDASGLPVKSVSEKVGPLETATEYQQATAPVLTRPYPAADRLLKQYVLPTGRNYR
jgi:hypothetical protein